MFLLNRASIFYHTIRTACCSTRLWVFCNMSLVRWCPSCCLCPCRHCASVAYKTCQLPEETLGSRRSVVTHFKLRYLPNASCYGLSYRDLPALTQTSAQLSGSGAVALLSVVSLGSSCRRHVQANSGHMRVRTLQAYLSLPSRLREGLIGLCDEQGRRHSCYPNLTSVSPHSPHPCVSQDMPHLCYLLTTLLQVQRPEALPHMR